jgi:hypothetical protein
MKSAFALACMGAVSQASIFSGLTELLSDFPVTKDHARARFMSSKRDFVSNPTHAEAAEAAHHNVRAQRKRLGLQVIGARPDEDSRKAYDDLKGLPAYILGLAQGLQYSSGGGGKCFNAVESGLNAGGSLFYVLTKVYMPWYIPEAQLII